MTFSLIWDYHDPILNYFKGIDMLKSKLLSGVAIAAVITTLMPGCARNISSDTYKADHVGEASFTYQGKIISARHVDVQEGERLEDNTTGMGLGALAGGVGGYQIGKGRGNIAATAGGAVLGGLAGAFAEKALKQQTGTEYVVKLTNGSAMTVVQAPEPVLKVGQHVMVIVSQDGRSRVVADNSGYQDVQPMSSTPSRKHVHHHQRSR